MLKYTSERRCIFMALKGQKFIKYSNETKTIIIEELKDGYSCRYLSRKYGISEKTISTWQQKLWHPEKYPNQGLKRGRQKNKDLSNEDYKERYEIVKKYQAFLKVQREKK